MIKQIIRILLLIPTVIVLSFIALGIKVIESIPNKFWEWLMPINEES